MSGSENTRYGTRALPWAGHLSAGCVISCCTGDPRSGGSDGKPSSAAVKDVVAEFLHLEDRGVRAPGDWFRDMRIDDLADDDVVVALLDDAGDPALDRGRCGVEDRCASRAFVNGLAGELAVFELGRLEESERDAFAVLAEHV